MSITDEDIQQMWGSVAPQVPDREGLNPEEREYVGRLWKALREANKQAAQFSRDWRKRKTELKFYCEDNRYNEHQTRQRFGSDWALNDAMDGWKWWAAEAQRLSSAIIAEKAARDLLGVPYGKVG